MTGNQEQRLRHLIAGAQLDAAIDAELDQWKNARDRLHDVGAALIAVSTPVSENLGKETVQSALEAFKTVGQKVNERADDIQEIHQALSHAVTVTRQAQTAVAEMDGDQRDKPQYESEPPAGEADEMHDLKVYMGQMKLYNAWADAREQKSQEHADKVETAWQDAIAVMQKIPDDQVSGGGGGGGGGGGTTGPIMPTAPTTPATTPPGGPTIPDDIWVGRAAGRPDPTDPDADPHPDAHTHSDAGPPTPHVPTPTPVPPGGGGYEPTPLRAGSGLRPLPRRHPRHVGHAAPIGDVAPAPAVAPGSLSGYAVGGAAGMGVLGGLAGGLRAAGIAGAAGTSGGLRSGGVLGATGRTAGSARGSLGARSGTMAGGAAAGRGTGGKGSRSGAGARAGGGVGAAGGRGKDKDKKKRKPATVELFDDDQDWIDDEGASKGVID